MRIPVVAADFPCLTCGHTKEDHAIILVNIWCHGGCKGWTAKHDFKPDNLKYLESLVTKE